MIKRKKSEWVETGEEESLKVRSDIENWMIFFVFSLSCLVKIHRPLMMSLLPAIHTTTSLAVVWNTKFIILKPISFPPFPSSLLHQKSNNGFIFFPALWLAIKIYFLSPIPSPSSPPTFTYIHIVYSHSRKKGPKVTQWIELEVTMHYVLSTRGIFGRWEKTSSEDLVGKGTSFVDRWRTRMIEDSECFPPCALTSLLQLVSILILIGWLELCFVYMNVCPRVRKVQSQLCASVSNIIPRPSCP